MTDQAAPVTVRRAAGLQRCMREGCQQPAIMEIYGRGIGGLQTMLCQPHGDQHVAKVKAYYARQAKRQAKAAS